MTKTGTNPLKLFEICLNYVANNIEYVESLELMPSLIGEQIFKKCLEIGSFSRNPYETTAAVKMFSKAYGAEFASSVQCSSLIFVSEYLEMLEVMLSSLESIDLSYCELGNDCSLLSNFYKLEHLKELNLKYNKLSEIGMRKIFLPKKVFKKGFEKLEILDLSGNVNACKSSAYLKVILNLPRLRVFSISYLVHPNFNIDVVLNLIKNANFWPSTDSIPKSRGNLGWVSGVMDLLNSEIAINQGIKKDLSSKKKCISFYNRIDKRLPSFQSVKDEEMFTNVFQKFKEQNNNSSQQTKCVSNTTNALKRKKDALIGYIKRKKCENKRVDFHILDVYKS